MSEGVDLKRLLFSLKTAFQADRNLVYEFVSRDAHIIWSSPRGVPRDKLVDEATVRLEGCLEQEEQPLQFGALEQSDTSFTFQPLSDPLLFYLLYLHPTVQGPEVGGSDPVV